MLRGARSSSWSLGPAHDPLVPEPQQPRAQTLSTPTCLRPSKLMACQLPPSPRLRGGHLRQQPPSTGRGGHLGGCERRGPAGPGSRVGAAGAYWVMSARSSLPRKLSWQIWCQERRPSGACRGEVAAPASAWAGSGWALSLDHFHLTGDNTDKKQTAQAIRTHAHTSTAREPRGHRWHRHGVSPHCGHEFVGSQSSPERSALAAGRK